MTMLMTMLMTWLAFTGDRTRGPRSGRTRAEGSLLAGEGARRRAASRRQSASWGQGRNLPGKRSADGDEGKRKDRCRRPGDREHSVGMCDGVPGEQGGGDLRQGRGTDDGAGVVQGRRCPGRVVALRIGYAGAETDRADGNRERDRQKGGPRQSASRGRRNCVAGVFARAHRDPSSPLRGRGPHWAPSWSLTIRSAGSPAFGQHRWF